MKNINLKSLVAITAALICVGCVDELKEVAPAYNPEITDGEVKSVEFVIPGFVEEDGGGIQTKTTLTSSGFVWAEKDTVGIFPSKGNQIYYEMSSGAGSSSAEFDGGGWALKDEHLYSSYYPLQGNFYLDRKAIPVTYDTEVTQVGNNNSDHLGANAFMFAPETKLSNGKVTFKFWQLGSVLKPRVTLPAGTYTKLVLSTDEPIFVVSGKYDLTTGVDASSSTATYPDFVPVIVPETGGLTNKLTINLEDVTFSSENELTAYIMAAPVDVSNIPITVTIYCGDSPKYRYEFMRTSSFVAQTNHNIRPNEKGLMSAANSSESANAAFAAGETSLSLVDVTENASLDLVLPETSEPVSIVMASDEGKCAMSVSYPAGATVPEELNIKASNGSDLTINTPESTVTLDGERAYDSVRAATASNTLIIDEDVTIGTLYLEKGNVLVYGEIMALNTDDLVEGETPTVYVYGNIQGQIDDDDVTVVEPDLVDLSSSGTANSYLVKSEGKYKFNANVKGNSSESVGTIMSVEVVWESFGTAEMPKIGDIISSVSYNNGYVTFKTTGRDGNALIAVKDGSGTILWSWHIWCASEGFEEQIYANNAGTMMDRNLGALSATPGDDKAVGLCYQWGRKDPFVRKNFAVATGKWYTNGSSQTMAYAIKNPTTLITDEDDEWHSESTKKEDWKDGKTIYDPCPSGWKVADNDVWAVASTGFSGTDQHLSAGVNLYDRFIRGDGTSWYPYIFLSSYTGSGDVWANTYEDELYYTANQVDVDSSDDSETLLPVRCQRIGTGGGASSVSLSEESLTLNIGGIKQITTTVMPSNSFQGVTWSSNNTACVSVDSGILTALSCGTATVTATSVSNPDIKASCLVTVTDPNNDESNPLTFVSNGQIEIALEKIGSPYEISLYYSVNGGGWIPYTTGEYILLNDEGRLSFRSGEGGNAMFNKGLITNQGDCYYQFVTKGTGTCSLRGNINSLLDPTLENETVPNVAFYCLFKDMKTLTDASHLYLPFLSLSPQCYFAMFRNCTNLTAAPDLPATTLADYCYENMFYGCTSLTAAPDLPATTLADYCYMNMFYGCTSLISAPDLSATTLAEGCCYAMFRKCTSLNSAPVLHATTMAVECYFDMFRECASLATAPDLSATTLAEGCYSHMFQDCINLINVSDLPATTLADRCYDSMFSSCNSLATAPDLPATTLTSDCYRFMFEYCNSLTSAPDLPALTLKSYCYQEMFTGCTRLSYIKMLATDVSATYCLHGWVGSVASTGTFVKNRNATWSLSGNSGVPSGWVVVYDEPYPDNNIEFVDLGLSVKWATSNLGASLPEESGAFYQWAGVDDVTSTEVNLYNMKAPYQSGSGWTKYVPTSKSSYWVGSGSPDNKKVLDSGDDIAQVTSESDWRIPTEAEFAELVENCQCDMIYINNIYGMKFTSKISGYTDKWIFLPAAGESFGTSIIHSGSDGLYWSSSLDTDTPDLARYLYFGANGAWTSNEYRFYGLSVRPVCE